MSPNNLIGHNPLNAINETNEENSFNEGLKKRIKKVEVMFEDNTISQSKKFYEKNMKNNKINYTKNIKIDQIAH